MSEQIWWYVARSGGIVAWGLLALSMCWGLMVSTRAANSAASPKNILGMHRYWSLLSVVFTGVHIAGLVADNYVTFGWAEVLVPWASEWQPTPVAWGVIGFYLLVAIEVTSLLMRRMPRPMWGAIHRMSFALFVFATLHGIQAGTDISNVWYRLALLAAINIVAFLTVLTLLAKGRRAADKVPAPAAG
ncbi:MAG: ferric reductase-like transmembrane domain-containing protein [Acidimicrobiales bacterium]|nr:ferric reductase-like transmembrane domain-containing protein [Acidimicrobiales bacterium]